MLTCLWQFDVNLDKLLLVLDTVLSGQVKAWFVSLAGTRWEKERRGGQVLLARGLVSGPVVCTFQRASRQVLPLNVTRGVNAGLRHITMLALFIATQDCPNCNVQCIDTRYRERMPNPSPRLSQTGLRYNSVHCNSLPCTDLAEQGRKCPRWRKPGLSLTVAGGVVQAALPRQTALTAATPHPTSNSRLCLGSVWFSCLEYGVWSTGLAAQVQCSACWCQAHVCRCALL